MIVSFKGKIDGRTFYFSKIKKTLQIGMQITNIWRWKEREIRESFIVIKILRMSSFKIVFNE